jgi:hypothetical protein
MLDCSELGTFAQALDRANGTLVVEVSGVSSCPDVHYEPSTFIAFDPKEPLVPGQPTLLFPNTTTFVDVVLDRCQTDKLLVVKDSELQVLAIAPQGVAAGPTGRAALLQR